MDYSKLSLTQAKRLEMESQVHALELEKELEMERTRLAELRKIHYHLAGASEGWEVCKYTDLTSSVTCTASPLYSPMFSNPLLPPPSLPTHTFTGKTGELTTHYVYLHIREHQIFSFFCTTVHN